MTKLKTLENIGAVDPLDYFAETICRKELRREAIKWIKEIKLGHESLIFPCTCSNEVIDWIERFFNITNED